MIGANLMPRILVFDVNETLLDIGGLLPLFEDVLGEAAALKEWFSLLLLHSEVATLAGPYFEFAVLARAALQMTATSRDRQLSKDQEDQILARMAALPPHPDVASALRVLKDAGLRLVTLTNSSQQFVERQLKNAGIADFFERSFSVDSVRRFKPAPEPYRMVAAELGVETMDLRLVAAHAWDIVGAMQAGCAAAFVARPGKVLFPLTAPPDIVGSDFTAIAPAILAAELR